jgi:hypothetical protein
MKKLLISIAAIAVITGSAFAGAYRVSYTYRGLGKQITVLAESTAEARRTLQDLFPGCYVTGAYKTGK